MCLCACKCMFVSVYLFHEWGCDAYIFLNTCISLFMQLRIKGTVGSNYLGDIAIDDINFKPSTCTSKYDFFYIGRYFNIFQSCGTEFMSLLMASESKEEFIGYLNSFSHEVS